MYIIYHIATIYIITSINHIAAIYIYNIATTSIILQPCPCVFFVVHSCMYPQISVGLRSESPIKSSLSGHRRPPNQQQGAHGRLCSCVTGKHVHARLIILHCHQLIV